MPKAKEKPAAKDGKTGKCAEERDNESRYSFQNYDSRQELLNGLLFEVIFTVFVPRLVLANREGNLVFNIMYGKFWFDGDFFVPEIWTPVRSSASTSPFHKGTFFTSLDRMVLSFFVGHVFFFFYLRLSSAFNFSMSKDFFISSDATCEFYKNKRKIHFFGL